MENFAGCGEAMQSKLAGIYRTAAAEADNTIGIRPFNLACQRIDAASGHMLRGTRKDSHASGAQRSGDVLQDGELGDPTRSDHQRTVKLASFNLLAQCGNLSWTVDDTLQAAQIEFTDWRPTSRRVGSSDIHARHPLI